MKHQLLMLTVALSCTFAGHAMAMTKVEYKTDKDRISGDYKVAKDKCASLKANAKDICVSEAKGVEKVARAELEAKYKPSEKLTQKVSMVKADTAYDTAKEKCDDLSGNAKDDAKIAKVAADTSTTKSEKMATVKKDAATQEREAMYKAANERCDSLAGAPKNACQNDAKVKYGM